MTSDWLKVYELYNDMSDEDKKQMFEAIKNEMSPDGKSQLVQFLTSIRETRFQNGLACIHCGSVNVKRNGKYRNRQRYLCMDKDCGKSFNDISGTPLSGTHKPELWMRYFERMVDNGGKSLPKIAKKLRIHVSTAFYWRHKILNGLRAMGHTPFRALWKVMKLISWKAIKVKEAVLNIESRVVMAVSLLNVGLAVNKSASLSQTTAVTVYSPKSSGWEKQRLRNLMKSCLHIYKKTVYFAQTQLRITDYLQRKMTFIIKL